MIVPMESEGNLRVESEYLKELQGQKAELLAKVQFLKKDLQDWRAKLDTQVHAYKAEISDLRGTLDREVVSLKGEFMELRAAVRSQLELTAALAAQQQGNPLGGGGGT